MLGISFIYQIVFINCNVLGIFLVKHLLWSNQGWVPEQIVRESLTEEEEDEHINHWGMNCTEQRYCVWVSLNESFQKLDNMSRKGPEEEGIVMWKQSSGIKKGKRKVTGTKTWSVWRNVPSVRCINEIISTRKDGGGDLNELDGGLGKIILHVTILSKMHDCFCFHFFWNYSSCNYHGKRFVSCQGKE